jgi:hypothetical protein
VNRKSDVVVALCLGDERLELNWAASRVERDVAMVCFTVAGHVACENTSTTT